MVWFKIMHEDAPAGDTSAGLGRSCWDLLPGQQPKSNINIMETNLSNGTAARKDRGAGRLLSRLLQDECGIILLRGGTLLIRKDGSTLEQVRVVCRGPAHRKSGRNTTTDEDSILALVPPHSTTGAASSTAAVVKKIAVSYARKCRPDVPRTYSRSRLI